MYAQVFILLRCINFHSLFQLCPTYFLSVNALPARRSQFLWELRRSRLLQKLVKITFLHTYLWYRGTLVPKQSKSLRLEIVQIAVFAGLTPLTRTCIIYHVYNEHHFTLLYWRKKNIKSVIFKIWSQSAKEIIGAFSSLSWRRKEGLGKIMTMLPFSDLFSKNLEKNPKKIFIWHPDFCSDSYLHFKQELLNGGFPGKYKRECILHYLNAVE